jgi:ubiquinone/menaquinone biosynthesis C-methylase UbiE
MTRLDLRPYLMEAEGEAERLEEKTDAAETRRQLGLVGVRPGQAVLDAGGGTGAVSRVISEIVGPTGRVVCLDRSEQRLEVGSRLAQEQGCTNLTFHRGDILDPRLDDRFDLIWARFVLEYLPDPVAAVHSLTRLLRPGGKLVVGDVDGHGLFLDPLSDTLHRGLDTLFRALEGQFDPFTGRKLFRYLLTAGLEEVAVQVVPYHVYAGSAPASALRNWSAKFATIRRRVEPAFTGDPSYGAFVHEFLTHLRSPDTLLYSCLILAEGRAR